MTCRVVKKIGILLGVVCLAGAGLGAADLRDLVRRVFAVPSTTGNEERLAAEIRGLLGGAHAVESDGLGSIAVRVGTKPGPTLLLAALDEYGFMVSGITAEGYLTVDRPVAPPHARYDAYLLGQPVVISTGRGPVQGVVAQPALHLLTAERRRTQVERFSLEYAFIDIAVRSAGEARLKGIELLDAVTFRPEITELAGGRWAGPSLGVKAAAAALLAVAAGSGPPPPERQAVIAWAAQTKVMARGRGARPALGALRAKTRWAPERTIIIDVIAEGKEGAGPFIGGGPVLIQSKDEPWPLRRACEAAAAAAGVPTQFLAAADPPLALPFSDPPAGVLTAALPVRYLHTPAEVVDLKDLEGLVGLLQRFLGQGGGQ